MKRIKAFIISLSVLICAGTSTAVAQDDLPPTKEELKKTAQTEKRKAQIIKELDKKVAAVEKRLKLREDQQEAVRSFLLPYYLKRHGFVAKFRAAQTPEDKKAARQAIRKWGNQLKTKLTATLDEKQMKTLQKIIESDMEALNPPPAGGGGGFGGGFGDGGGGGGGGDGGGE